MPSTSTKKKTKTKKKASFSFTNWVLGGPLVTLVEAKDYDKSGEKGSHRRKVIFVDKDGVTHV